MVDGVISQACNRICSNVLKNRYKHCVMEHVTHGGGSSDVHAPQRMDPTDLVAAESCWVEPEGGVK